MILCLLLNGQEASEVVNFEWLVDPLYAFFRKQDHYCTTKWEYIPEGGVSMEGRIMPGALCYLINRSKLALAWNARPMSLFHVNIHCWDGQFTIFRSSRTILGRLAVRFTPPCLQIV